MARFNPPRRIYRSNGPTLPNRYRPYALPYGDIGAAKAARLVVDFQSGTPSEYDGFFITLSAPQPHDSSSATWSQGFTFDDDAAPPSIDDATVKIQGLASAADIAEQFALAVNLCDTLDGAPRWKATRSGTVVTVEQLWAGARGNLAIAVSPELAGQVVINGVGDFEAFTPWFYGGVSLNAPAIVGGRPLLMPSSSGNTPESVEVP